MKNILKFFLIYILKQESRLVLWKYKPKVVAITGSVGKTSTKDAVFAVLAPIAYVRKSEKSYNSEIGLPLTILGLKNGWNNPITWFQNILKGIWLIIYPHKYPEWLVLEVGVGKIGDMAKTASWLHTDAVIITAIGETPAHIEFFYSRKNLIEEKSGLIKTLKKDGLLILNADDIDVLEMKNKTKNITITYGFNSDADVKGSSESIFYDENKSPKGVIFRVDEGARSIPVFIEGVFGNNHIYASLAALAFTSGCKFNMLSAVDSLKNYDISPGRMHLLDGIKKSSIIDDTYNSSPFACEASLCTLGEVKSDGRKIAILGDMLELGKHTEEAHKNIGKIAKDFLDILCVVGPRAQDIKNGAIDNGMKEENIFEFSDSISAGLFIKTFIKENDLILVKGSQGMRMERVVEEILLDKKNKKKLLVRQEKEWLEKN
jgi:UDP-N-acetylmuramoyl-tripeptide--D-alanyl-D-alanine ligase